ncbi:hypothetical protein [Streptomyces sp. NPDC048442]|uniref:hypothetical protein n=1 Tax=Streptomyces sp. NPDC048442 TaxID=3154823 RepID=UPI00343E7AD6
MIRDWMAFGSFPVVTASPDKLYPYDLAHAAAIRARCGLWRDWTAPAMQVAQLPLDTAKMGPRC